MKKVTLSDLRVRKVEPDELPVFRHHPEFVRNNCFIVDLKCLEDQAPVGGDHQDKNRKSVADRICKQEVFTSSSDDIPMEGLEIVGNPLEISMLSPGHMDPDSIADPLHTGYHSGVADEMSTVDINPLLVRDAAYFFYNFEMSDTIKNQLLTAMGFAGKHPTTYSLVIFARGDDVDRTICFVTRRVDSLKYSGRMHNYGPLNESVRGFLNFKLLAQIFDTTLRSIVCQSTYNALCDSQIIGPMPRWPKCTLPDLMLIYDDEKTNDHADTIAASSEFIPGVVSIQTKWTDNAMMKQTLSQLTSEKFPINYFEKPGGLFDAVVVVKPGWLDNRVKSSDRSVRLRFLMYLCDCLGKEQIDWPSKCEQPKLLESFNNYVSNLSAVESAKQSYDFTEGLWDYLCCCRSLASVRAILKQTYEYYTSGVLSSKYVHADNTSQTALILKMVDSSNAILPRLDQWTCVESIIQIGVDRLRRDMINELMSKKRFAESSFGESLKITARDDVCERVNKILRMHLILQSVNLISEHVAVQPTEMQNIFNILISQYSKFEIKGQLNRSMLHEEFRFNTKVCNVEESVLGISRLREWSTTYEFTDKSGIRSCYTVHLTRFHEFKNLAENGFSQRFPAKQNGNNVSDDQLYWDNFDCCTFQYGQKNAINSGSSSSV